MDFDPSLVKAICFDIDGTLSNTDDQFVQSLVRFFSPARWIFRARDMLPLARRMVMLAEGPGNWVYSLADKLGLDNSLVALSDFIYELGADTSPEPYQIIEGVHEMLVELHKFFPLSIISARGQKAAYRFLFQFELMPLFTAVATGQTCIHTKPFPHPVLWAAETMGVAPSACLMVGDTVVDIIAGKNAGAQTAGVLCGFGELKELRSAGANLIVNNPHDLLNYLPLPAKLPDDVDESRP